MKTLNRRRSRLDIQNDRSVIGAPVGLLQLVQVVVVLGITMTTLYLPHIRREFAVSPSNLGFVSGCYSLTFGGLLLVSGRVADHVGAACAARVGAVFLALGSVCCAAAQSFVTIVVGRAVQGAGAALLSPAVFALAVAHAGQAESCSRSRLVARWGVLSSLGAALGMSVCGAASEWISWRWLFVIPGATSVALLASLRSSARKGSAATGSVQARRATTLPLLAALTVIGVASCALAATYLAVSLRLQVSQHVSPVRLAALFGVAVPAVALAGAVVRHGLGRWPTRGMCVVGLGLTSAALGILAGLGDHPAAVTGGVLLVAAGSGTALSAASVLAGAADSSPTHLAATTSTAMELGPVVGTSLLVPVGLATTAHLHTGTSVGLILAGLLAAAAVAAVPFTSCDINERTS